MNTAGVVEVNGPQSKEWLDNIHLDQIPAPLAVIRRRTAAAGEINVQSAADEGLRQAVARNVLKRDVL
jgi:hypothetical protein